MDLSIGTVNYYRKFFVQISNKYKNLKLTAKSPFNGYFFNKVKEPPLLATVLENNYLKITYIEHRELASPWRIKFSISQNLL